MKIVKEHINEKFIEDSDPIHDMHIGGVPVYIFKLRDIYRKRYKGRIHDGRMNWSKRLKKIFVGKKIRGKFRECEKYIVVECINVRSWNFGDRIAIDTRDKQLYFLISTEPYFIL